jgi:hypothetical protein
MEWPGWNCGRVIRTTPTHHLGAPRVPVNVTSSPDRQPRSRAALTVLRLLVGAVELAAPERVTALTLSRRPEHSETVVARILGARHLGQGLVPRSAPFGALLTGPLLDTLHSASMVGLAVLSPRHRRPALASATVSGSFAVLARRR